MAARLLLDNGRRCLAKALGPRPTPNAPDRHRSEARIAAGLPPSPAYPRLLAAYDHGGWIALVFEDIDGANPAQPWDPADLQRVLDTIADLAVDLTPSPVVAPDVRRAAKDSFNGWRKLSGHAPFDSTRRDCLST